MSPRFQGTAGDLAATGPLWFRGYALEAEAGYAPKLEHVLQHFKANYMVVGHSIPAAKRITPRLDGRVFLIDTGMLASWFQGRSSALDIAGGQFQSLYVGEPEQPLITKRMEPVPENPGRPRARAVADDPAKVLLGQQ